MPYALTFDASATIAGLAHVRLQLRVRRPELLRAWGRDTVDRAHRDFDVKSRGGTGADGVQWRPLAAATLRRRPAGVTRIGVVTGILEEPAGDLIELNTYSVTAGFGDPHAEFFDETRPLLPERLPDPWYQHLEQMAEAWGVPIVAQLS